MDAAPQASAGPAEADAPGFALAEATARALDKAVRAHHLYDGTGPSFDRFVESLRAAFAAAWAELGSLTLETHESRITWKGSPVYEGEHRPGDLAFLFYRDGIRELVFRPGFEADELPVFLGMVAQVQRLRNDQDDLITLFWEHDFEHFVYRHVDASLDGPDLFAREPVPPRAVDAERLRSEIQEFRTRTSGYAAPEEPTPVSIPEPVAGQEILDPTEARRLRDELRREFDRDLMRDVLHALLDRLQDGASDRQQRVIDVLADLLPGLISGGRFGDAALVLQELTDALRSREQLPPEVGGRIDALLARLAEPDTISEMVRTVEDAHTAIRADECAAVLRYFPPAALEPLLVAAENTQSAEVRDKLLGVAEQLTADDPRRLMGLLAAESPVLAAAAARLVARLRIAGAAPAVGRLLARAEPAVRLAAIAALQALRASSAAGALQHVLDDADREVRLAAARALGALGHPSSRPRLETLIQSKRVRDADISERLAFFEAYGAVAGVEGIDLLARMLNGRSWLGRREAPEVRASAALALGRIAHPAARDALGEAADDPDVVVRTAVLRSLRREDT